MSINDRDILRALARQYREICDDPVQTERRDLWRRINSLKDTRPLIYVRAFAWQEMPQASCLCVDPLFREQENLLRYNLFWNSLDDDSVFEPWITLPASRNCSGWGVEIERHRSGDQRGAYKIDYAIKTPEDLSKLRAPRHEIDEAKTAERAARLQDAVGDILTVDVDRSPAFRLDISDISGDLGHLRGIENFMMDMVDDPEWLHSLVKFLADGIANVYDQAEEAGDWSLSPHRYSNQAMPYSEELPDPSPNARGTARGDLWAFMAAQEFTGVSPAMHDEFMLQYQIPILSKFGLSAYGCCEDLTHKIEMLRQVPNLRRIAVSPFANAARCAEQIGRDYVVSYRPSPADMVSYGFDRRRIRDILSRDLSACRECHVDITLKDVETVEGDPNRVREWVKLTREVIAEVFG